MTTKRESISPSLRWSIFHRDGFCCRYCGRQAGEEGVELAVDHVVSVKEGGTNAVDNLVTACRVCNSGKGAKSLLSIPGSDAALARMKDRTAKALGLAEEIKSATETRQEIEQELVNLKCKAFQRKSVRFPKGEITSAIKIINEFGADKLYAWYCAAYDKNVTDWDAIKYVCGIARNVRQEQT